MRDTEKYNQILSIVKAQGLSRRDADGFYAAYEQALQADFGRVSIGCAIMCGGRVIGTGHNQSKSDPIQKRYNLMHRTFHACRYSNREHSGHAEISALRSIPRPVLDKLQKKRAKAYVFRISEGKPLGQGLSAPCAACAHALSEAGIREVLFSTDYGFASSSLTTVSTESIPYEYGYSDNSRQSGIAWQLAQPNSSMIA